jgi:hypothetical protein
MISRRVRAIFTVAAALTAGAAQAQAVTGDPGSPMTARVLGTAIHTQNAEEVRYVVLGRLTDRYAADMGITATQAEVEAYLRNMRATLAADRARYERQRDALRRKLAAPGLSEAERKSLSAELDSANRAVADLSPPAQASTEDEAARQQIAAAFIRQWKINQALYRQYGGRIIFQQGGPEPLDAYRRFLLEREARGDFAILSPAVATAFWRYYLTDSIHSFYRPGSAEEAKAFASPPWASKPERINP